MKQVILSSKDVCKSFANNGSQNHVLDMVCCEIYQGDFTVIMGSSGSGKSTLLYCLSGMDKATSGSVWYEKKDIYQFREKDMASLRIDAFGFIFQQMYLVSNLSLLENVAVTGYLKKDRSNKQVKQRAKELIEEVHILEAKDRLPSQVSGGEAQRAAIARAMINDPALIFADEPTGALNRKNTEDVLNLLTSINRQGQSILMVTHDIRAAIRGNRLLFLDDGRLTGEMTLPDYNEEQAKSRETQVNSWLTSMDW